MRLENTRCGLIRMQKCQTVILFLLGIRSVAGVPVSGINCGDICSAVPGSPHTLTCTWSGTLGTGIIWLRDSNIVSTCDGSGSCFSPGYSTGNYPNATAAVLTITSFDSTADTALWECRDGPDPQVSCTLPVIATGSLQGKCTRSGNSYTISCSGITSHGSPPATLKLMDGSDVLGSITSGGSLSSTQTDAAGKSYTCEVIGTAATCLSSTSVDVTCEADCLCQCSCACEETSTIVLIIAVILLAVLIAFIIIFCVCNIKKYYDQYRLAVFIGTIVVCIGAIACTVVVFVLASTVEKPQADDEKCCCSTCEPDGMEMKNKCVGLKIYAAFFSILDAVLTLIIIIIILIVWCCPGKCATAKLLMCCYNSPAEAGPTVRNNSKGGGTPSNTVTSKQAKPKPLVENNSHPAEASQRVRNNSNGGGTQANTVTSTKAKSNSPVENSTGTSYHSRGQQSENETTAKGTDERMDKPPADASDGEQTSKDHEENGTGPSTEKKKSSKPPADASDGEDTLQDHEENQTGPSTEKKKSSKRRKKKIGSKRGGKTE